MTNVYLNATGKPLMVTLPDGGNIDLKAGEAIVGDYFERYTRTGSPALMIPVSDMGMKRISKIHNPMVLEITAKNIDARMPLLSTVRSTLIFMPEPASVRVTEITPAISEFTIFQAISFRSSRSAEVASPR